MKNVETPHCDVSTNSKTQKIPLQIWYDNNPNDTFLFEKQMKRKIHYVIEPQYLWDNIAELARTQSDDLLQTVLKG